MISSANIEHLLCVWDLWDAEGTMMLFNYHWCGSQKNNRHKAPSWAGEEDSGEKRTLELDSR